MVLRGGLPDSGTPSNSCTDILCMLVSCVRQVASSSLCPYSIKQSSPRHEIPCRLAGLSKHVALLAGEAPLHFREFAGVQVANEKGR